MLGWYLPKAETPLVNIKFMNDVRFLRCYCLKYDDVKLGNCQFPPPLWVVKSALAGALDAAAAADPESKEAKILLKTYISKYDADKPWLLNMLATVQPDHAYFKPSYRFVKPTKPLLVRNEDGLFDAVGQSYKRRKRSYQVLGLSKA